MTPPFARFPVGIRVMLMFLMLMFNLGVVSFIAMALASKVFGLENMEEVLRGSIEGHAELYAFLFIQGVSSLGGFLLTAIMFSVLESGEFKHHLGLMGRPSVKFIALGVVAVLVSQFFIEFLVDINKGIPLPAGLGFLYDLQKQAEELTNSLMTFTAPGSFIIVVIVVALIPALAEEFFFRGLLLGDLLRAKVHPALAITLSAFVFGLSHFQYDNFLAIWVLGGFLGYLYYVSGSLWLPVIAHFVNNFLGVLLKYLLSQGVISQELADAKTPWYATVMSVVLFASLIFLFHKWEKPVEFVDDIEGPENETP